MNEMKPIAAQTPATTKRVLDFKSSFATQIDAIGAAILADPEVVAVRIIEPPRKAKEGPSAIYFFAREPDVRLVLGDDKTFTLHPYDVALSAAAGDVRFILGAESQSLRDRREMVAAVIGTRSSPSYEALTDRVRIAAREAATEFTTLLRRKSPDQSAFNVIRDFGYLIPYLTTARVIGVSGPDKASLFVRFFVWLRNISGARYPLKLTPEQAKCHSVVMWAHVIFGHIFTNFQNRDRLLLNLASLCSREFNAHIDRLIADNVTTFDDTLVSAFLNKRRLFPEIQTSTYKAYVRSILFELSGAMTLLVSISFGRILHTLVSGQASWPEFFAQIRGPNGEQLINEALRLNSTTSFLFRRVARTTEVGGVDLQPGDHVCVLIGACGKDGGPFRNEPPPNSAYVNFGPHGGPHACLGQKWARVILQEMLGALADVEGLRPATGVKAVREFRGLPDELEMFIAPP